ncbi:MAG: hypothetical protein O3B47_00825 [bacterium]|nr:hypothetical protein [bacterium]
MKKRILVVLGLSFFAGYTASVAIDMVDPLKASVFSTDSTSESSFIELICGQKPLDSHVICPEQKEGIQAVINIR